MPPAPRVLAVLTFDPWPVRSGITRRLDALVRALDGPTALRVLVLDVGVSGAEPSIASEVVRVSRDPSKIASVVEAVQGVPRARPVTAAFYLRPALRAAVGEQIARFGPDVVVTHGVGGAELVRGLVEPRRVVLDADTIDPETYRRIGRDTRGPRGLQWRLDARLLPGWHRRTLPALGGVTVVSAEDERTYRQLAPGANLHLVPNGVDVPPARHPGDPDGPLLFVGAMDYPPNRSAVDWFAADVLPLLPGMTLRVVGGGSVPAHPQVEASGFVADLAGEWRAAAVLVVPIRAAGGTRLKVLEAFAHGLPVVSTQVGVEGLGAVAGQHYLRAETPADMASAVRQLRADPALRERLSVAARDLVAPYSWAACTGPLVELVTALAQR